MVRRTSPSTLFPYTTLFRSIRVNATCRKCPHKVHRMEMKTAIRSEERFSRNAETELVCRLLLEKKKELYPLGASQPRHIQFKLIAATNRDLREEVVAGRFRQDLFYRVSVTTLRIPSFLNGKEDIAIYTLSLHDALPIY